MATEAQQKITKAKVHIGLYHPFFAIVGFGLDYIEIDEETAPWCKTMATDGRRVWWSRQFVDKLSIQEVTGVLIHEIMHVVWLHMTRRGDRDPKMWNVAGDYAINLIVKDLKLKMPGDPGTQLEGKFQICFDEKYRDWSVYKIYDDLMKNAKKITVRISMPGDGGKGDGEGEDNMAGIVIDAQSDDGKPLTGAEKASIEEEVKIKVMQAAVAAKSRGNLPAGLEGLIEAVGQPKIDWKDYIQNWVKGRVPDNYTWTRSNRKWMATHGIYMPSMQVNGAGHGVLSIDTSGSVSDAELVLYITEIVGVIEMCNPDKLTIIQHDAVVQKIEEWEAGDDFSNLKTKGRGGTCVLPAFKAAEALDEPVDWMICFTDMGIGDWPQGNDVPNWPVLWCATGPDIAPFGTYINIKEAM